MQTESVTQNDEDSNLTRLENNIVFEQNQLNVGHELCAEHTPFMQECRRTAIRNALVFTDSRMLIVITRNCILLHHPSSDSEKILKIMNSRHQAELSSGLDSFSLLDVVCWNHSLPANRVLRLVPVWVLNQSINQSINQSLENMSMTTRLTELNYH